MNFTEASCLVYLTLHPKTGQVCLKNGTIGYPATEGELEVEVSHFWIPSAIESRLNSESEYFGFSGQIKSSAINPALKVSWNPAESVFGISRKCRLSNIIQVNHAEVMPKPEQMSPQQAATLPSCLILAQHAFQQAASGTRAGGLVVIHEANRDMGIAGLLVAQAMGFSVICTSSEPRLEASKRLLKATGALVVTDSQCTGNVFGIMDI
jgi:hypothetical protein